MFSLVAKEGGSVKRNTLDRVEDSLPTNVIDYLDLLFRGVRKWHYAIPEVCCTYSDGLINPCGQGYK